MARDERKEYWGVDLPKDHPALQELDKFCTDEGMISRADATRMILVAWGKLRRGQSDSVWPGAPTAQPVVQQQPTQVQPLQGQGFERPRRALNGNAAAVELDV
jgi:hypothetical protein